MEIKFYGAFDALVDFHTAVNIIVQGTLYTRDRDPSTFDTAVQSRYFKMSLWRSSCHWIRRSPSSLIWNPTRAQALFVWASWNWWCSA